MFSERLTPLFALPFGLHMIAMAVSAVVLILRYREKKYLYQLLMLIGILSTSLVYFVESGVTFYILAIEEILIYTASIVLMIKETPPDEDDKKEQKAEAKEN